MEKTVFEQMGGTCTRQAEEIHRQFGIRAIYSACIIGALKMPGDGRCSVVCLA